MHFLHFTDCHAQLLPVFYREPKVDLGTGAARGKIPHRVGRALLEQYGMRPGTVEAYTLTYLDFEAAARRFGAVGGFAHLATLVKRLRAERPGALLLDGGDTWQGSATSLWTRGQDMVEAAKLLGVDIMTAHWEMTYGTQRVLQIAQGDLKGRIDLLAQNVRTSDFGDPVFASASVPVYTDRASALAGGGVDVRNPRAGPAERGRGGARSGSPGCGPAVA